MRRPREQKIEVGKSYEGSVEQKYPQIHESREDLYYNRPDPLKVEGLNPQFRAKWVRDIPDNIALEKAKGYILAEEKHFTDPSKASFSYGDLRLAVIPREIVEEKKKRLRIERRSRIEGLQSLAERDGVEMTDSRPKKYVQGWSFS